MWPMYIHGSDSDFVDVLRQVKDSRRRTPSNGWAYFASRFLNPGGQQAFDTHGPVEIVFNYLGLYQQFERDGALFCPPAASVDGVPDMAGDVPRFALIDVSVGAERGRLRFSFIYNRHMQHQEGIRRWIANCEQTLLGAAEQLAHMSQRYTLCDFPLLSLTYNDLDAFVRKVQAHIPSLEVEGAYPCSPIQRGILINQAKDERNYRTRFIWKVIAGEDSHSVDLGRLQQAWQRVINRHAILRTIFIDSVSGASTDQVVRGSALAEVDVVKGTVGDPIAAIEEQLKATGGDGRLLHRLLLYAAPTGTFCALDINHALIDAHSVQILERDLRLAYDGKLPTGRGPLFSDYIAYLQRLPEAGAEAYWKAYMKGVEPCVLPTLCDQKAEGEGRSQFVASVDLGSGAQLHTFCQHHEVTLANLFQVAWGLLLRTYTGSSSICFGYLNSGRDVPVPEVQDTVGPFINMLVCRMEPASDTSLLSLVQGSQKQYLESLPYQHYSLADVLHLARMPCDELFNTVISVQRLGTGHQEETSIGLERVRGYDPTEYDAMVTISIEDEHIRIHLSTWTTSLSDRQAQRVSNALGQLVFEIVERPYCTASQLNLLGENDRKEIYMWNRNVPKRVDELVHKQIEERCRTQPNSPAVCAWDGDFTYAELDQLSSALAIHLMELGIRPGVFVPLCFEKSRWTTVAILSVMKAGGAFVLLDSSHPSARLQRICQEVSAPVIVTSVLQRSRAEQLAAQVVVVGDKAVSWQNRSDPSRDSTVAPQDPLYIVFTSGSTGRPKGAIVTHAAFSSSALRYGNSLALTQESRVLQFVSYGFDVSISDSLTTLLFGACICVPSETVRMEDPAGAITAYKVNWALLTPSVIKSIRPQEVPSLRSVALIGEPMSRTDVATWAAHVRLVNSYGPAECSVVSAVHGGIHSESEAQVISRGVGCACWIADPEDHERLLPIGAVGELLIEGPIVGHGYLNDPVKSAAAFIKPPTWLRSFRGSDATEDCLYKTGDLVRYTADGSLQFIGRRDTQVKIRGQRIELGEIEHYTRQCFPGAQDVVAEVVTPTEVGRPPMLVAFLRVDAKDVRHLDDDLSPPTDAFRAGVLTAEVRLYEAVPAYMVPAVFLPLVAVPLTTTGKTDRRRLRDRAAALSRAEIESYRVAASARRMPATTGAWTLRLLWGQVLKMPPDTISADDSFFRLGGDSVTAMLLVGAARKAGLALYVTDVFQCPRLFEMSNRLDLADRSAQKEPSSFVNRVGM
ncbi:acetyl-CoA synthetase-like protein [Aspergillus steynii IBT 23096]|uniref:Acetyl-CoA synthetase-like protein n=1 Tax=Aspergillus steynii IBT 23096 TaxID=1392250 RepID=A0A2I2FWX4_9EURO|nr:acetyl-CoA synthetase-like protein [Aspergillus steynii IBT 23096]PLB45141.1 acetyl-CoA synthetase-like protein [Aspergillus steynii IBT 23096]